MWLQSGQKAKVTIAGQATEKSYVGNWRLQTNPTAAIAGNGFYDYDLSSVNYYYTPSGTPAQTRTFSFTFVLDPVVTSNFYNVFGYFQSFYGDNLSWTIDAQILNGNGTPISAEDPACMTPDEVREAFGEGGPYGQPGDPVNSATGNFATTETDLGAPDGSWGMEWDRTYNSRDAATSALGTGWSPAYSQQLTLVSSSRIDLVDDNGRLLPFNLDSSSVWQSPPDFDGTLTAAGGGGWDVTFLDGSLWHFDTNGRLSSMAAWDGQTVTVSRDTSNRVSQVAASTGYTFTLTYAGALLDYVTDSDGRVVDYGYDTNSRLTSAATPAGTTTYTLDTTGRVATITDPGPATRLSNVYDTGGRVTSQSDAHGNTSTFTYNSDGSTTVTDSSTGATVIYHHDSEHRLDVITDPFSVQATRTWDANDNLTSAVSRGGGSVTQTFDSADRLLTSTTSEGTTTITYDSAGRVSTITAPNGTSSGATTTFTYDGTERLPATVTDDFGGVTAFTVVNGLVTDTTDPDGVTTTYTYDSRRRVTSIADEAGNTTVVAYCADSTGLTVHVRAPRGAATTDASACTSPDPDDYTTETRYDLAGRVVWEKAADGGVTSYSYDTAGRMTTSTDPTSAVTTYAYNSTTGELASVTTPGPTGSGSTTVSTTYSVDFPTISGAVKERRVTVAADGARTERIYGPLHRLEQVRTQTEGASTLNTADDVYRTTAYTYTVDGQVATVTNGAGDVTTTRYDALGRVIETCDGEGRRTINSYTAGRLITVRGPWDDNTASTTCATGAAPAGSPTTTYQYDDLGRQTAVVDPVGNRSETHYTYAGRVDHTIDPAGLVTQHHYDTVGRLEWIDLPGATGARRTTYGYDADSNITTVVDPTGTTTTTYDPMGRVLTVTDPAGVTTTSTWTTRGELATRQLEGQGTEIFHHDAAGALDYVDDALGRRTTYGYDRTGRSTDRTDTLSGVQVWAWYDDGQVRSETDELNRTTTYTYDAAGRQSTVSDPSSRSSTTSYNDAGQPTSVAYGSGPTITYTYDAAGRQASATNSDGTWTWTYAADGALTSAVDNVGRTTTWAYDDGRRTSLGYPDGSTVLYGYESATGRIDTLRAGEVMADSFTGANGQIPETRKWNISAGGGGTAALNGNRLNLAYPSTAGANAGVISDAPNATDIDVSFRYQFADTANAGLLYTYLRETTGSSGVSYRIQIRNNNTTARIYRFSSSTETQIGTFTVPVSTDARRLHVQIAGNQIKVNTWADGTAEPSTWGTTVTDSTISGSGRARLGWVRSAGASSVTIDDWRQTDLASPPPAMVDYTYNNADQVTGETLLSGARSWAYTAGELTGFSQTVPGATRTSTLTRDSSGRIASVTTGSITETYGYDNAGQLLSITPTIGASTTFTYDQLGRRATRAVTSTPTVTYAYDAASQLTSATPAGGSATTYTYDGAGRRLTASTTGSGSSSVTNTYDRAGRLATQTLSSGTVQARSYTPEGRLNTVANTSGGITTNYTLNWDGTELLGWSRGSSGDITFIGPQDRRVALAGGPTNDHVPTAVDAFGSALPSTGDAFTPRGTTYDANGVPSCCDTVNPRVGYRGELQLLGLVHLRSRDYEPVSGTFTTVDPLEGVKGSTTLNNPYHYANNSPLGLVDPLGLSPVADEDISWAAAFGAAGMFLDEAAAFCVSSPAAGALCLSIALTTAVVVADNLPNIFPDTVPDFGLPEDSEDDDQPAPDPPSPGPSTPPRVEEGPNPRLPRPSPPRTVPDDDEGEECSAETQAVLAAEPSSPDLLKANMRAAGVAFPPFPFATHHIVAGNAPGAAASRSHLHSLCVGINEAVNGVFLRTTELGTGAYHPGLHTDGYYSEVESRVLPTSSRDEVSSVLREIAAALQRDEFPH